MPNNTRNATAPRVPNVAATHRGDALPPPSSLPSPTVTNTDGEKNVGTPLLLFVVWSNATPTMLTFMLDDSPDTTTGNDSRSGPLAFAAT